MAFRDQQQRRPPFPHHRPASAPALRRAIYCSRDGLFVPRVDNADVVAATKYLNQLSTDVHQSRTIIATTTDVSSAAAAAAWSELPSGLSHRLQPLILVEEVSVHNSAEPFASHISPTEDGPSFRGERGGGAAGVVRCTSRLTSFLSPNAGNSTYNNSNNNSAALMKPPGVRAAAAAAAPLSNGKGPLTNGNINGNRIVMRSSVSSSSRVEDKLNARVSHGKELIESERIASKRQKEGFVPNVAFEREVQRGRQAGEWEDTKETDEDMALLEPGRLSPRAAVNHANTTATLAASRTISNSTFSSSNHPSMGEAMNAMCSPDSSVSSLPGHSLTLTSPDSLPIYSSREAVRQRANKVDWLVFWGDVQKLGGEMMGMVEKLSLSETERSRLRGEVSWLTERLSRANEDFKELQLAILSEEKRHQNMILVERDKYNALVDDLHTMKAQISDMRRRVTSAEAALASAEADLEEQAVVEKELRRSILKMSEEHNATLATQKAEVESSFAAALEEVKKKLEVCETEKRTLETALKQQDNTGTSIAAHIKALSRDGATALGAAVLSNPQASLTLSQAFLKKFGEKLDPATVKAFNRFARTQGDVAGKLAVLSASQQECEKYMKRATSLALQRTAALESALMESVDFDAESIYGGLGSGRGKNRNSKVRARFFGSRSSQSSSLSPLPFGGDGLSFGGMGRVSSSRSGGPFSARSFSSAHENAAVENGEDEGDENMDDEQGSETSHGEKEMIGGGGSSRSLNRQNSRGICSNPHQSEKSSYGGVAAEGGQSRQNSLSREPEGVAAAGKRRKTEVAVGTVDRTVFLNTNYMPLSTPADGISWRQLKEDGPFHSVFKAYRDIVYKDVPAAAALTDKVIAGLWEELCGFYQPQQQHAQHRASNASTGNFPLSGTARRKARERLHAKFEDLLSQAGSAWRRVNKAHIDAIEVLVTAEKRTEEDITRAISESSAQRQNQNDVNFRIEQLVSANESLTLETQNASGTALGLTSLTELAVDKIGELIKTTRNRLAASAGRAAIVSPLHLPSPSVPSDTFPHYGSAEGTSFLGDSSIPLLVARSVWTVEDFCNAVQFEHDRILKRLSGTLGAAEHEEEMRLLSGKCEIVEEELAKRMQELADTRVELAEQKRIAARHMTHKGLMNFSKSKAQKQSLQQGVATSDAEALHEWNSVGVQCELLSSDLVKPSTGTATSHTQKGISIAGRSQQQRLNTTAKNSTDRPASSEEGGGEGLPSSYKHSVVSPLNVRSPPIVAANSTQRSMYRVTAQTGQEDALYYQLQWLQRNGGLPAPSSKRGPTQRGSSSVGASLAPTSSNLVSGGAGSVLSVKRM